MWLRRTWVVEGRRLSWETLVCELRGETESLHGTRQAPVPPEEHESPFWRFLDFVPTL